MSDFSWIAPLKEAVLLLFFLLFSGLLIWVARWPNCQQWAQLPLDDQEVP